MRQFKPRAAAVAVALAVAFAAAGLAASGASAAVTALQTQAVTDVGIRHATFHGTATGATASDYCAFVYGTAAPAFLANQARRCDQPFSTTIAGLTPGLTYYVAAVHCADPQPTGSPTYCAQGGIYPFGWDLADTCLNGPGRFFNVDCPSFTMGLATGTTQAATSVRGTSATLNAVVHAADADPSIVTWRFEYSTDASFAGSTLTDLAQLDAGGGPDQAVSAALTDLSPATTYYVRVIVKTGESPAEPTIGAVRSFRTGGYAGTGAATSVQATTATLNGEVAAGDAALGFRWLLSTSGTSAGGLLTGPGVRTVAGGTVAAGDVRSVSATAPGLSPSTTYYAQLVTDDPSIHGAVVPFTTLSASCPSGQSRLEDQRLGSSGLVVTGCFTSAGSVHTGHGPLTVNGLAFSGPAGGTVTIDLGAGRLSATKGYAVNLGTVALYPSSFAALTAAIATSGGTTTFRLPQVDKAAKLFSLTIGGTTTVGASSAGGASVAITALGMPVLFNGLTAEATVRVRQDGSIAGVTAQLGNASIGAMTLPGVTFSYDADEQVWDGEANLILPLADKGVKASLQIKNGKLNGLGAAFAGTSIPLDGSGLVLNGGSFSTVFSPLTLNGSVDLSLGPRYGKYSAIGFGAGFSAGFNQDQTLDNLPGVPDGTVLRDVPFTLKVNGSASLLGVIQLASTELGYYGVPGWPFVSLHSRFGQAIDWSCGSLGGRVGVDPALELWGNARGATFNFVGRGQVKFELCGSSASASATAALSSAGIAICGSVLGNSVGIGGRWPASVGSFSDVVRNVGFYSGGCNVGSFTAPIAFGARAAQTGGATVRLPGGLPFAVIRVTGRDGAPRVTVTEPNGRRIVMAADRLNVARNRYLIVPDPRQGTTYVTLTRPQAGRYRVSAQAGSTAISQIRVARGLPAPSVRGGVSRRGASRVVRWHARARPGQEIVFHAIGPGGDRILERTRRTSGSFAFRPTAATRGASYVTAHVHDRGVLAKVVRIGSFRAPTLTVPGAPSKLVVQRRGTTLSVSWKTPKGSVDHYLVRVTTADGARRQLTAEKPKLTVRRVPRHGSLTVTAAAVDPIGRKGRASTRRLR